MRSIAIIPKIQEEVKPLLENTSLSCEAIGKIFNCSRGPIWNIQRMFNISRPFHPRTVHFPKQCKWCGKVKAKPGFSKTRPSRGKFCSKQCYTLWQKSEDNKGKKHPNWVDGGKHEDYLNHLRKGNKWKQWREQVFQRDNYTCQMCGERGLEFHPHHIKQKCDFPELIFEVDNGITLCKECHMSKGVHSYKSNLFKLFLDIVKKSNEAQLFHR